TLTVSTSDGSGSVLNNASDPDVDPLTAVLVSGPQNGTLALDPDGSFAYEPDHGFIGTDSFVFVANDGILNSNQAAVNITVTHQAPSVQDQTYSVLPNQPLIVATGGVLANASDPDGDPLEASLVSGPSDGSLDLNPDGTFSYVPNVDFAGFDQFTFQADDGV